MRWLTIAAIAASVAWPKGVEARHAPSVRATVTAHGLRVTLRVSKHTYPLDAIVAVTVMLRNTSKHRLSVEADQNAPRLLVAADAGGQGFDSLQPLGSQTLIDRMGPGPRSMDLSPGETWTGRAYVVLAGTTLTSVIGLGSRLHHTPMVTIAGPQIRFHLTSELPPHVVISDTPLQATLTSPVAVATRFIWYGETRCEQASGDASLTSTAWTLGGSGQIRLGDPSGCTHFTWHAIAGWLGHPIATITYDT